MKTGNKIHTNTKTSKPKAILVGVSMPDTITSDISLEELEGLATTANYDPVATLTQNLAKINPKTFLGSGKVNELRLAVEHHEPEVVIFDEELSPRQNR